MARIQFPRAHRKVLTLVLTDAPITLSPDEVTDAFKKELEGTPGLLVESMDVPTHPDREKHTNLWLHNLADQLHEMLTKTDL